jgi:hypothetical protein
MAYASLVGPLDKILRSGPPAASSVSLSSGFNTLTRPTGADGVVIFPDPSNTQTLTLKGVTGDTGLALSTKAPSIITCAANVGITAGGATTVAAVWFRLQ